MTMITIDVSARAIAEALDCTANTAIQNAHKAMVS